MPCAGFGVDGDGNGDVLGCSSEGKEREEENRACADRFGDVRNHGYWPL